MEKLQNYQYIFTLAAEEYFKCKKKKPPFGCHQMMHLKLRRKCGFLQRSKSGHNPQQLYFTLILNNAATFCGLGPTQLSVSLLKNG